MYIIVIVYVCIEGLWAWVKQELWQNKRINIFICCIVYFMSCVIFVLLIRHVDYDLIFHILLVVTYTPWSCGENINH